MDGGPILAEEKGCQEYLLRFGVDLAMWQGLERCWVVRAMSLVIVVGPCLTNEIRKSPVHSSLAKA